MHFGLFNLMQMRDPATRPEDVYAHTLNMVKLADQAGFEMAWFAEHHFSTYSLCASPMVMAAWCAPQTKRIKLAPGVLLLPLYEPARLVQEIGMLDIMSEGRFVLGLGTGYQPYEFERFKIDLKEGGDRYMEFLDILELALTQGEFAYRGRYYHYPEACIAIRTGRKFDPVYVAGVLNHPGIRKRTAERRYVPLLAPGWNAISLVEQQLAAYKDVGRLVGTAPADFPFSIMRFTHVTDSRADALAAAESFRYSTRVAVSLRFAYGQFDGTLPRDLPAKDEPSLEQIVDNCLIGSPEHCAGRIVAEIQALSPVHYALFMQCGAFDMAKSRRSMERFVTEVMPLVRRALPDLDRIGGKPGALRTGIDYKLAAAQ